MKNIVIRKPEHNDMNQLVQLCSQHAKFEGADYSTTGKTLKLAKALLSDSPVLFCYVIELSGNLCGYVTASKEFSTWNADYFLHMDCLYLTQSARGKGLGQALMAKIQQLAADTQCTHIEWQTPIDNEQAIDFYHRRGASSKNKKRFIMPMM